MSNEYQEIIATLDRISAMQDRMIERMEGIIGKMDNMIDKIPSDKLNDDAVASMNAKYYKWYHGK